MVLAIASLETPVPRELPIEIVERKGLGHPDSICDALSEAVSIALSRAYLERFGTILHHNVDKALLCGGASRAAYGGGELLKPIEIYLAGRATCEHQGVPIDVEAIAVEASQRWMSERLRHLDVARDVRIYSRIRPTSPELRDLFLVGASRSCALANDTSFGVGFAPYDQLECAVLAAEQALSSPSFKRNCPWVGDDVKVMGVRQAGALVLTVACALVGKHVASRADNDQKKARAATLVRRAASEASGMDVEVAVNAADEDSSVYLTVTGLSAESGDDGQVGRGNRVSGLITPYRPMSLEAAAGKNPVSHVGKLYNVVAHRLAHRIAAELDGVCEVQCYMVSQIGHAIDDPQLLDVKLKLSEGAQLEVLRPRAADIARDQLAHIGSLWRDLVIDSALQSGDLHAEATLCPAAPVLGKDVARQYQSARGVL